MVYVTHEDDTHERRTIRNIPEELWQRLRVLAVERRTYISTLVIEAIRDYLERADQEER